MKQFMGFKMSATASVNGTNLHPDATTTKATSPEKLGTALPGIYATSGATGKLVMINAAADFLNVKSFVVARGNAKGSNPNDTDDTAEGAILSDEIDRKTLKVEKYLPVSATTTPIASAAKKITLGVLAGDNLIGGVPAPANATAGVTIVDNSPNIMSDWKTRTYEVRPATGATAAAVATALATKINADPNRLVDAAPATTTLVLTHRKVGVTFDAHGTDETICANCTKVVTTQPIRAEGTAANLRELELECAGYQGQTRRGDGQLGDILPYTQIEIDTVKGCVVYHLTWERQVSRQGVPVDARASRFLRLYLAVPAENVVMIPALDALLVAATQDEGGASADQGPALLLEADVEAAVRETEKENDELEKKKKEAAREAEKKLNEAEREAEKKAREDAREQGGAEPKKENKK